MAIQYNPGSGLASVLLDKGNSGQQPIFGLDGYEVDVDRNRLPIQGKTP
jgi:hypothetical protein